MISDQEYRVRWIESRSHGEQNQSIFFDLQILSISVYSSYPNSNARFKSPFSGPKGLSLGVDNYSGE